MKKVWIAIAALIAVLAAAVLIMNLVAPKEKQESGDAESLYAYYYEKRSEGLILQITGDFPEGCKWNAVHSGSCVEAVPQKQTGKAASFLLKPVDTGEEILRFDLQRDVNGVVEGVYEIAVTVLVSRNNEVKVLKNTHHELTGIAGGEDTGIVYRVIPQTDGMLQVTLQTESRWELLVEGTAVSAVQEDTETGSVVRIDYHALGQSTVWLREAGTNRALELYVTTDLREQVALVTHEITEYVSGYTENSEADAFRRDYGNIQLPADALGQTMSVVQREIGAESHEVGCLEFSLAGRFWQLYLSKELSAAELADCSTSDAEEVLTVEKTQVYLWQQEDGGKAGWRGNGCSYLLMGREAGTEEIRAVLGRVMAAVQNG